MKRTILRPFRDNKRTFKLHILIAIKNTFGFPESLNKKKHHFSFASISHLDKNKLDLESQHSLSSY